MNIRRAAFLLCGWLWLAALAAPQAARAQAAPLPLAQYWQLVEKTRALADRWIEQPAALGQAGLDALAGEWEAFDAVQLPDGSLLDVQNAPILAMLRAEPPDLSGLQEWMSALQAARADWTAGGFRAADVAPLRLILARPEYQWTPQEPSAFEQLLNDLWERFLDWLAELIGGDAIPGQDALYALGGALALGLILFFVLRHLLRGFVAEVRADEHPSDAGALTAQAALQRAQQLSAGGDRRSAVRYLYLSALLLLDERGLLRYDRARTNHEVLRSVAHLPQMTARLSEVIDIFDRVWYGFEPLDEASFDAYARRVAELSQQP